MLRVGLYIGLTLLVGGSSLWSPGQRGPVPAAPGATDAVERWTPAPEAEPAAPVSLKARQAPKRAAQLAPVPVAAHSASPTLAEQIARALPGDTLRIQGGVFREPTIVIAKPVHLLGIGWPVLDGEGQRGLVEILANGVSISGFVFRNTGVTFMEDRAAVRLSGASDCRIQDNRFEETFFGLYLAKASRCTVSGNVFETTPDREANGGNAIHSWYSDSLRVTANRITGHRDGIYLEFTTDSWVGGNTSTDNLRYGLHFMFSDRCTYEFNTFARNGAGVAVMYADDVVMHGNRFEKAWGSSAFGLLLKEIKDGSVTDNRFSENSVGVFVESTDRLRFERNVFDRNGWGVRIMADASDNGFEGNVFTRNTFDVATNSRTTSASSFSGNYWDRYRGYDLDQDGFGDVPFHPVRFYAFLVEQHEPALVLLRSAFVDLLDAVEAIVPLFTPKTMVDPRPLMQAPRQQDKGPEGAPAVYHANPSVAWRHQAQRVP